MRPVILIAYVVMALALSAVSVLRLALSVGSGVPVDGLPFVTGGLGLFALAIRAPTAVRSVQARIARRSAATGAHGVEE